VCARDERLAHERAFSNSQVRAGRSVRVRSYGVFGRPARTQPLLDAATARPARRPHASGT
jgi:hypothetical protein